MDLTPEGSLTIDASSVINEQHITMHVLTFDVYLLDLDPEVVKS